MSDRIKLVGIGFLTGILSGLLGVGGGTVMIPMMVTYMGFAQHNAQSTSLAVIIPTALVGSVVYGAHSNLDLSVAVNLAIGSIVGASIGAHYMKKIPAAQLKKLFGAVLILIGLRMVL